MFNVGGRCDECLDVSVFHTSKCFYLFCLSSCNFTFHELSDTQYAMFQPSHGRSGWCIRTIPNFSGLAHLDAEKSCQKKKKKGEVITSSLCFVCLSLSFCSVLRSTPTLTYNHGARRCNYYCAWLSLIFDCFPEKNERQIWRHIRVRISQAVFAVAR